MATAYVGTYGSGRPVIDFLAEYDALFGLSQKADCPHCEPASAPGDPGHGCGHELLGVGSIAAAIRVKEYLQKSGHSGTVRIVGCPAEESGSGKVYLARSGFFKGTDIALTWHPGLFNQVCTGSSQSCISLFFKFHGVSSHAAGNPQQGRSALDAAELTDVGVNYLREHMESTDRVHYAYIDAGGKAPNVVQSQAILKYFVRSTDNQKCQALMERVINCAKGAALMTGTTVEVIYDEGLSNTVNNFALEDVLAAAFRANAHPQYTEEELRYAKAFADTFDRDAVISMIPEETVDRAKLIDNIRTRPINDYFVEVVHSDAHRMGSTDVGDVSWVVPTAQINTACFALGASSHSWQWVAQGKSSIAHKGAMLAGTVLAAAAQDLIEHPEKIQAAQQELQKRLDGKTYQCLIPADVMPHVSTAE